MQKQKYPNQDHGRRTELFSKIRPFLLFLILLCLTLFIGAWLLSYEKVISNQWAPIFSIIMLPLGVMFAILQWLFPISTSEEDLFKEKENINQRIKENEKSREEIIFTLQQQLTKLEQEIHTLKQKDNGDTLSDVQLLSEHIKEEVLALLKEKDNEDVLSNVKLQLKQIEIYYTINTNQAKRSFYTSIISTFLGFVTVVLGIWLLYFNISKNLTITILASIPGILLQFLGGTQFFIYRKSIGEMGNYFQQLIRMQDTMLAIKLSQNLSDKTKQEEQQEKIIASLLERSAAIFSKPKL